jgi:CRP/FNR family transcriptional regulator
MILNEARTSTAGQRTMIRKVDLANLILSFQFVQELSSAQHKGLLNEGQLIEAEDGEVVYDLSRDCAGLAMVTRGNIRVIGRLPGQRILTFYRLSPGNVCILTASSLLGNRCYPARGIAEGSVKGVWVTEPVFGQMLDTSASFRASLFQVFAERFAGIMHMLETFASRRLDQRVAALLLDKGNSITMSHQMLAAELGSAREVVSRILKDFEKNGWLLLGRQNIRVADRQALQQLAETS